MAGSQGARRWARRLSVLLGVIVAGLTVWVVLAVALGAYHAQAARSDLAALREQASATDAPAALQTLGSLQQHTQGVGRWLGGAPITWLTWLPGVGDTLAATATIARATHTVADEVLPAGAAVLAASDRSLAGTAQALQQQRDTLTQAADTIGDVVAAVAAIDPDVLIGPAKGPISDVQQQIAGTESAVKALAAASVILPGLLGVDGPTDWVLVASQPAEARGSGAGFFGAYGDMRGENGQLQLLQAHSNNEVFDTPADLSVLPPQFAALWGESAAYIWGHNLTRHFPYAAQLLAQTTARAGQEPAFVVALDPQVLAALLELTGPVSAAGVTIDEANAVQFLTRTIYQQFPDSQTKDRVALEVMAGVLDALQTADPSPVEAARVLAGPLAEQRLVVWAADPPAQQTIALSPVAGAVPPAPMDLTVAFNNAGGNKMDAYLHTSVEATVEGCGDAAGAVSVDLELRDVPPGLPDYTADTVRGPDTYGATRQMVHVYGPPGARLVELLVDGQSTQAIQGSELDRPVWGTFLDLVPGKPRNVTARFAGGMPPQALGFLPQPMINRTIVTLRDDRTCL